ncbi:MAG: Aerobic respiration control sensor protein ArcB [Legionellaceae bacterium]
MSKKSLKALVVEDSFINQDVARIFLKDLDYEVVIAKTGKEAIEVFDGSYDFVLMDVGLPDIDGTEVVRLIREKEIAMNTRAIIIGETASGESYRAACINSGMDDFLVKPILFETLKNKLNKYEKLIKKNTKENKY